MLLTVDIGNTETTIALFTGDRVEAHWRLTTVVERTPDEWAAMLTSYFMHAGRSTQEVRAAVLASVAPRVTESFVEGIKGACQLTAIEVGPGSDLPLTLDVDEPMTVGADRVVNTLAAATLYRRDTIVVDFGTATTFDCITADCRFLGGVISPGFQTGAEHLTQRAAKLPATELTAPDHVIGKRTEDCIRAGVVFGAADAVAGIVRRIKSEWPSAEVPYVVATGGLAPHVAPLVPDIETVEPMLTLIGLRIAAGHLGVLG
jgi:type III pantothenate kinase